MKLKVPALFMLLSLIVLAVNHFVLDWESITKSKVERYFDALIEEQQIDLLSWEGGPSMDEQFQKRTYCDQKLVSWSNNKPWVSDASGKKVYIASHETGIYLGQMQIEGRCTKRSIYPLSSQYEISNKYLRSRLSLSLPRNLTSISATKGDQQYKDLFFYSIVTAPSKSMDAVAGLTMLVVLLVIIWNGVRKAPAVTLIAVFLVRLVTLYFSLLPALFRYPLFFSVNYTSSFFNPNLGDLLMNCLLVFIIILGWSRQFRDEERTASAPELIGYLVVGWLLAISVFSAIWGILDNSQLSMDVGESIDFGVLRTAAFLSVILVAGSQFLVMFRVIGLLNKQPNKKPYLIALLVITGISFLISLPEGLIALLYAVIVLFTSYLGWANRLKEFKYQNLQFVLLISVSIASVLSISVYKFHEKSELDAKRKFANHLLIKRDVLGEYYLNQVMEELAAGGVDRSPIEEAEAAIRLQLLNPYFDKYSIEVIHPDDGRPFEELSEQTTAESLSDYDRIYFVDLGASFYYVCKLDQLLVRLTLKKRVPSSVYPALLTDNKYFTPSDDFDYAVFQNGDILFQRSKFGQGEWPDTEDLTNRQLFDEGIEKNNRHYYGVKTVDGRIILIISKKYSRQMQLSNFSFFFLINLFFIGSIVLLSSLNIKNLRLNFVGKIQLYLGLAFAIPLFVAGFALLNSLNLSYKDEITRNYLKRSLYLSELLSKEWGQSIYRISSSRLADIRDIMQADISVYDSSGILLATSQREIFDLQLQSELINPVVYTELVEKENQSMIADEAIGGLEYKVTYTTLNDDKDQVQGFIAMPFFDSKNHLNRQQLEIFGNLISIFGMIFIVAVLFGNIVLNNLMSPLRLVADKIRQVTLQEENKPIAYESSDEIGSLVKDYNSMLVKLEQSKAALARSQKELAWKEIAKQVAHEIKNPLTPMQLKIQQLMRKYEAGTKDREVLSALLTQVDNLSQIAGSFSAFAEMPVPDMSTFDLSNTLHQVVSLYNVDDVCIRTDIEDDVRINADRDIFQRILNNIVLNAIQSVEGKAVELDVSLKRKNEKCLLSVQDNGKGVPPEMRDKIFMNYFSTKSKGSGIGLALAKKGIDHAGGNIWFESDEGKGTTFFISMPLAVN